MNQNEICGWCEVKVEIDDSHIDHIRAKGQHSHLTFVIENLVASCQEPYTCGHGRAGKGDLAEWIHPYETADLERHFYYEPDGAVKASESLNENQIVEAEFAINDQLNLNARTLKERRECQMAQIRSYVGQDLTLEQITSFFPSFPSLTAQVLT